MEPATQKPTDNPEEDVTNWVIPENVHTHALGSILEFPGGGGRFIGLEFRRHGGGVYKVWNSKTHGGGHPKTQTMQTADCRPQTVQTMQTVQTEYFFSLHVLVFAFSCDSHIFWFCSIIYCSVCYPQAAQTRWLHATVDVL